MASRADFGGLSAAPGGLALPGRPGRRARVVDSPVVGARPVARLSFGLLVAFVVLLHLNLPLLVPATAPLAPAQTAALAGLVVVLLERAAARRPFQLAWPEGHLLLGFVGVALLGTFTALWPRYAAENALVLLKFVAVYLLFVNAVESWRRVRKVMWALALAGLFPAIGALYHRRIGELVDGQRAGWVGIFENPNDLAYALVVLFPITLALALESRGARRLLLLAALGVYVAAVLATFSRGGLLGLTAVLLLAVLRWTRSWFRLPVLLLVVAALMFALPAAWQRAEGYGDLREDRSVHQRVDSLRAGLAMAGDRPLLGVGLGCSMLGWEHWAPADRIARKPLHTHNSFVQVLAETGLIGAAIFLSVLGAALAKSWRTARRWRSAGEVRRARLASAAEISLWGFLICSLAGGYLLSWYPYLILGLVSAIGAAEREE